MAELDYAFLADYARIDSNGCLTAIGASWTYLRTDQLPAVHRMAVAGRVRATIEEGSIPLRIEVVAPGGAYKMGLAAELIPSPDANPYGPERRIGHLFAADLTVSLPTVGLYEVTLSIEDAEVRRLKFEVHLNEAPLS